jgi:hypothetical protein
MMRQVLKRIGYWLNDRRYLYSFHAHCRHCDAELHSWSNQQRGVSLVAASWRAGHDQCREPA